MKSTLDNVLSGSDQILIIEGLSYLRDVKQEALETARTAGIKIEGREFTESDFGISAIQMLLTKFNNL